jgi:hypothetical protein
VGKSIKIIVLLGALIIITVGGLLVVFGLPGKAEFNRPVPIKWSRDVCIQCGMSIVDRYHTAEITNPAAGKAYKFDDIGDAVIWAGHNHTSAWLRESGIWVTDSKTGEWLDARSAYWLKGQTTPMGYGLGAVAEPTRDAFKWKWAAAYLLAKRESLLKMDMSGSGKK